MYVLIYEWRLIGSKSNGNLIGSAGYAADGIVKTKSIRLKTEMKLRDKAPTSEDELAALEQK